MYSAFRSVKLREQKLCHVKREGIVSEFVLLYEINVLTVEQFCLTYLLFPTDQIKPKGSKMKENITHE